MVDVVTSSVAAYAADSLTNAMADGEEFDGAQASQILSDLRSLNRVIHGSVQASAWDVSGTLDVDGATVLGSTLAVTGAATFSSSLTMSAGTLRVNNNSDTASASADEIVAGSNNGTAANYGFTILTDNTGVGWLIYGDAGNPAAAWQSYDHANTRFVWGVEGSQELYLNNTALRPASSGGLDIGASSAPFAAGYFSGTLTIGGRTLRSGSGSPEGVVTASVGALYMRSDGGAGTSFYVKESGTGNTGWVAK